MRLKSQKISHGLITRKHTHQGEMYGVAAEADTERTAFRKAEKRYKLYKTLSSKARKKQLIEESTDLSDVFDFEAILQSFEKCGDTPNGVFQLECSGFHRPVFCFDDRPGFYFIPGALSIQEQSHWIRESLVNFPQPPNRTNHNAMYGPIYDLFKSVETNKVLIEKEQLDRDLKVEICLDENLEDSRRCVFTEAYNNTHQKGDNCKPIPASVLLRKLRWSTLGLQFDWSKRNYDVSLKHNKIPDSLCFLAKKMAIPAMPIEEVFQPEGAIVNYFGPGDMLGGHVDDMEKDWSKPIVSISLGCKAIFLLGGKSRDDIPVAMFLRSGDVVLMAGQARECFHGIPRIFTDKNNAQVSQILSQFSSDEDVYIMDHIATSRININIRQVN